MSSDFLNLSKRKKRDLLNDLLVGASTEGIVSKKELNTLNKFIHSAPANNRTVKNISQSEIKKVSVTRKKPQQINRKTTYYLSEEIIKKLDKAQINIQSLMPGEFRSRISKSHLVNQALALMLEELETKGKNSKYLHNILRYL